MATRSYLARENPNLYLKLKDPQGSGQAFEVRFENKVLILNEETQMDVIERLEYFIDNKPSIALLCSKIDRTQALIAAQKHKAAKDKTPNAIKGGMHSQALASAQVEVNKADIVTRMKADGASDQDIAKVQDELAKSDLQTTVQGQPGQDTPNDGFTPAPMSQQPKSTQVTMGTVTATKQVGLPSNNKIRPVRPVGR